MSANENANSTTNSELSKFSDHHHHTITYLKQSIDAIFKSISIPRKHKYSFPFSEHILYNLKLSTDDQNWEAFFS